MYTNLNASSILIQVLAAVFAALTIAMASRQVRAGLVRVRSMRPDPRNKRRSSKDHG